LNDDSKKLYNYFDLLINVQNEIGVNLMDLKNEFCQVLYRIHPKKQYDDLQAQTQIDIQKKFETHHEEIPLVLYWQLKNTGGLITIVSTQRSVVRFIFQFQHAKKKQSLLQMVYNLRRVIEECKRK